MALLENHQIDLGLIGRPAGKLSCHYQPLQRIQDTFVCTRSYLENLQIREGSDSLTETLKTNATFMLPDDANITRQHIDAALKEHGIELNTFLEVSTMDMLIEFSKIVWASPASSVNSSKTSWKPASSPKLPWALKFRPVKSASSAASRNRICRPSALFCRCFHRFPDPVSAAVFQRNPAGAARQISAALCRNLCIYEIPPHVAMRGDFICAEVHPNISY